MGTFLSADEIIAMPSSMVEGSINIHKYKHSKYCIDKHHTKVTQKCSTHGVGKLEMHVEKRPLYFSYSHICTEIRKYRWKLKKVIPIVFSFAR